MYLHVATFKKIVYWWCFILSLPVQSGSMHVQVREPQMRVRHEPVNRYYVPTRLCIKNKGRGIHKICSFFAGQSNVIPTFQHLYKCHHQGNETGMAFWAPLYQYQCLPYCNLHIYHNYAFRGKIFIVLMILAKIFTVVLLVFLDVSLVSL